MLYFLSYNLSKMTKAYNQMVRVFLDCLQFVSKQVHTNLIGNVWEPKICLIELIELVRLRPRTLPVFVVPVLAQSVGNLKKVEHGRLWLCIVWNLIVIYGMIQLYLVMHQKARNEEERHIYIVYHTFQYKAEIPLFFFRQLAAATSVLDSRFALF